MIKVFSAFELAGVLYRGWWLSFNGQLNARRLNLKPSLKMINKNFLFLAVLFAGASALFTACKKSGDPSVASTFTWQYGGTSFTATTTKANLYSRGGGPVITSGMSSSGQTSGTGLSIKVESLAAGTYNFGVNTPNMVTYTNAGCVTLYSNAGTLQITQSAATRVSGTFSGTVLDVNQVPVPLTISFQNIPVED